MANIHPDTSALPVACRLRPESPHADRKDGSWAPGAVQCTLALPLIFARCTPLLTGHAAGVPQPGCVGHARAHGRADRPGKAGPVVLAAAAIAWGVQSAHTSHACTARC